MGARKGALKFVDASSGLYFRDQNFITEAKTLLQRPRLYSILTVRPGEGLPADSVALDTTLRDKGAQSVIKQHYRAAVRYLARHIKSYPEDILARLILAESLILIGRASKGLEHCDEVAGKQPYNQRAYYLRGRCLLQMGQVKEAASSLRASISLAKGDPDEIRLISTALAQPLCLEVLKTNPNNVGANHALLQIMRAAGEPESKVESHLRKLATRSPQVYLHLQALEKKSDSG
jgi:tetratricopeptide (TPR) repeat protein